VQAVHRWDNSEPGDSTAAAWLGSIALLLAYRLEVEQRSACSSRSLPLGHCVTARAHWQTWQQAELLCAPFGVARLLLLATAAIPNQFIT
jgi:hypothetical protein